MVFSRQDPPGQAACRRGRKNLLRIAHPFQVRMPLMVGVWQIPFPISCHDPDDAGKARMIQKDLLEQTVRHAKKPSAAHVALANGLYMGTICYLFLFACCIFNRLISRNPKSGLVSTGSPNSFCTFSATVAIDA